MKILTCPAQLQRLEGILRKSLPFALPVFGAVLNINRGNPGRFEVLVDKWPEFGAVLARPSGEVPANDGYWNTQAAFYRDLGAYRALLETPGCLRWDAAFTLIALQDGMTAVSQDLAGRKGVELDIVEYYSYWHPDPSTMPEPRRRYLAEILGRFPQVCLQDGSGQPVAWVLTDHFGTGTHSYTLPEQRRRGHMQVALTVAAQRAHARGFPTFGHTALGNRPMQQLQEMLGHQRLPGVCSYILHNPGLDKDGP
ncbi:glycine N-acyltransferase-like protein 3 isoform X2 [Hirundo rustica]|uniref:glycine N-acyltransferase-like protein 3 isoform X2 n=1 Tax=Hirundo rustica TaxID=43150 RepID=UPI001A941C88|nr:glycine N-acyltransferase-like protein 3 isoform X2 [Hirundo rustica]